MASITAHGDFERSDPSAIDQAHAETRRPPERPPFPADPRADQRARPRAARARPSDDRPSRARVRAADPGNPRRPEARLPDRVADRHLSGVGHRRLGSGAGQHAVARRSRADVRDRPLRDAVAQDGRQARARRRLRSRRLAQRRRRRGGREQARRRQGARDQGGAGRAQRDLDRRDQRDPADPAGDRSRRSSGAVDGRHDLVAGLDRLPARRVGRRRHRRRLAEGPDAAARPVVQRGQRQGARRQQGARGCRARTGPGTTSSR